MHIPEWFIVVMLIAMTAPLWWPVVVGGTAWLLFRKGHKKTASAVLGAGGALWIALLIWIATA